LSHFVIVNTTCLSLSLSLSFSLSLVESVGFVKSTDRTWKGKKKNKPTVCSKDSSSSPSTSSIDMYNNDVGQESAQKFMKQTGVLKDATLYFAS